MKTLNEIRKLFLNFFAKQGHHVVNSSSLIPRDDPTLLFTNAGMVQFKEYFIGNKIPTFTSATSSQKCIRAGGKHNDLENVGYTSRHHTFFEMLGNFSFGEYGKERAIALAWQFITQELLLRKDKLYVTVYHTDDEAANLWQKIANLPKERIIRIASNDNFWSMGDTGPCGPCSEIFYDNGEDIKGGLPGTNDEDGDRFVEIWNLVFMQYNRNTDGTKTLLPKVGIDTGMGLERITAVMQGVTDNYDTDLFQKLITKSQELTSSHKNNTAHKIITDHLRSSAFLIADGITPSNQGRGYVLRRIIRRAVRYIYQLNYKKPLLCDLFPTLIYYMEDAYPELSRAQKLIIHTLRTEEEIFLNTLGNGLEIMLGITKNMRSNDILSGKDAFKLYDTYGFPLDITIDLLKEKNIKVNEIEFQQEMKLQQTRAQAAWVGSGEKKIDKVWYDILEKYGPTKFIEENNSLCKVAVILKDNQIVEKTQIEQGDKITIILHQTPFYAESGGQLGDTGSMLINDSIKVRVIDTKKILNALHAHICQVESSTLSSNVHTAQAMFDEERRTKLKVAHSATHILHFVLRQVLGSYITQKGSMVAEERLRFDFNHNKALTKEELQEIEYKINSIIWANHAVSIDKTPKEKALDMGAMALFGEKYDDIVRVVKMGHSIELCGGTHVDMTGEIGLFKFIKESSIGSGIRRVEALIRTKAYKFLSDQENAFIAEIDTHKKKTKEMIKKYQEHESQLYNKIIENTEETQEVIRDINFCVKIMQEIPFNATRATIMNHVYNKEKSVVLFSSINNQQANCIVAITKDLYQNFSATELMTKALGNMNIKAKVSDIKELAYLNIASNLITNFIKAIKSQI